MNIFRLGHLQLVNSFVEINSRLVLTDKVPVVRENPLARCADGFDWLARTGYLVEEHMSERQHGIEGRCHCGNVQYVLHTDTAPGDITLRICRCDFCLRHRPRYWSDPEGRLDVMFDNAEAVNRYRFGHGTADFVLCRNCGVFAFAVAEIDGNHYAVTNLNLALDHDADLPEAFLEALQEDEAERAARRRRNWTPVGSGWPVEEDGA